MSHKKVCLNISGMHCASCEVLVERQFKKIAGVEKVRVNHATGKCELLCSCEPDIGRLQQAVIKDGYTVTAEHSAAPMLTKLPHKNTTRDYLEIGAVFLIIVAVYTILKKFDLAPSIGVTDNMSYGLVFMIGLVAAMSTCIAVTGGLLLAVAAKYNERHPNLTVRQKFRPHVYFNIGRVVSYTVLGGAVGALGSVLTLSSKVNGIVTVIVSIVMILLGFQLLHLFPWLRRFQPKMPKFLAHRIHDLSESDNKRASFFLGAGTFFLPCGFTQALQLYVLSTGSFTTGALTMFFFSLGTLPALVSLSAVSSFAKGKTQRYFLKFAGVMVLMVGFFNVNNGLALAGINFGDGDIAPATAAADKNVKVVNGTQVVRMKVVGLQYIPSRFTVVAGMPVEWRIDGSGAQGCAAVITAPKLGVTEYLPKQGEKVIRFTPEQAGDIRFSCTMGMTTRGAGFTVVDGRGTAPADDRVIENKQSAGSCNPQIQNCVSAQAPGVQILRMEVTNERGFYPDSFQVERGKPVELIVDAKVQPRGCMGVMVLPDYDVTMPIKLGENKLSFMPNKAGTIYATCAMGIQLVRFDVT